MTTTTVTVVVPLYKSAGSIGELVLRLQELGDAIAPRRLEIIFVDDGSPDDCVEQLLGRLPSTFDTRLLRHSRNFGSFAAIRTGMAEAMGDFVGVMAADLQEPPSLIPEMLDALDRTGADVAYGRREQRSADARSHQATSAVFWRLYRRFVQPDMPAGGMDIFLCRRHVVTALLSLEESNSSLVGSLVWLGFPAVEVPYERAARVGGGRSAWTLKRRVSYMTDSAFSFSRFPLTLLGWTGAIGMLACVAVAAVVLVRRLTGEVSVPGYTALMLTLVLCTSLLLLALWIVGEIAWRAFENTKQRPLGVVRSQVAMRATPGDDQGADRGPSSSNTTSE